MPEPVNASSKQALRDAAQARRRALTDEQRCDFSRSIIHSLNRYLTQMQPRPECLLSYRALPSEVDADMLFQHEDYQVFAPVTHQHTHMEWHRVCAGTKWRRGYLGVMEPDGGALWQEGSSSTVLICPLSAFDRQGGRLGMGKGCFDYWLAGNRQHIASVIGLAFSCQEVAAIPVEEHDMPMDCIITEREIIECPSL